MRWTEQETEIIRKIYPEKGSKGVLELLPLKKAKSIRSRAQWIGIKFNRYYHYIRKCRICGLEAHTQEQLKLFRNDSKGCCKRACICINCDLERKATKRTALIKKGLCGACGMPNDRYGSMCSKCISKSNKKYRKLKEAGLCVSCGQPNDRKKLGGNHCSRCLERKNIHFWELKKKALEIIGNGMAKCRYCGANDIRILTVNHKNGRNSNEKNFTGRQTYFRVLSGKRAIDDLEVTCYNCNILYEYTISKRWRTPILEIKGSV